jgi:ferric-dicitrate binding protein FerR (iron transport regulator)
VISFTEGDIVLTGTRSMVKIRFRDKSRIVLGPESRVTIKSILQKTVNIVEVLRGQIRARVNKNKKHHFVIKTKTASFAVRGTDFQVYQADNDEDGPQLYVKEGQVAALAHLEKMNEAIWWEKLKKSNEFLVSGGGYLRYGSNGWTKVPKKSKLKKSISKRFIKKSEKSETPIERTVRLSRENAYRAVEAITGRDLFKSSWP